MKQESKVKPFCIKYEEWMTKEDVATVLSKAVLCGALMSAGLTHFKYNQNWSKCFNLFKFFGVSNSNRTDFRDYEFDGAIEITLDQVDARLGLVKVDNSSEATPQSLVGCKIDLRNEDGSVNSELSAAFQEACVLLRE